MIDYSNIKIGFTNGAEFTLSAEPYVGYYHVVGGQPYQGIDATNNLVDLKPLDNLASNISTSDLFYDRILLEEVSLPYEFNADIFIAPNETCNSRLFNDRLYKLYRNTLYLYSQLFLASNDIPNGYDRAAGIKKSNLSFSWSAEDSSSGTSFAPFASAGYAQIDDVIKFEAVEAYDGSYRFLGVSPTAFVALSSNKDLTTFGVVNIKTQISENNDLQFSNLADISIAGKYAYACDISQSIIYKYDVSGYFSGDASIANRFILVDSIGGFGNAFAQTKFNEPDVVYANDEINRLYIHDKNNRCVKIYDTKLSYVSTRTFTAGTGAAAKAFGYNPVAKLVYMLIKNSSTNAHALQVCDKNLQVIEEYSITDALESGEEYKGFCFSKNDSNIFYLFTNKSVFKKFISKPDKTIGKWLIYKAGNVVTHIWNLEKSKYNRAQWSWSDSGNSYRDSATVSGMSSFLISNISAGEQIFLFVGSRGKPFNRIQHYNEYNIFNSALGVSNINAYSTSKAKVSDDEFVNAMVINKELYKIAFNTLNVMRFITGRYAAEYDYLNNLVYKGIVPLDDDESAAINEINLKNIYVHENELMNNSGVLNRCFKELYNLQHQALLVVRTKINNLTYSLSGTQTIVLN